MLSVLQKHIDTDFLSKNIMLILCGSTLSFMENKVLSEKSPLFGRRDSQMKLDCFNYRDSALFVPGYSNEEKAICFGITGGVAKYLSLIDPDLSLDDNIKLQFFSPDGYLYDEVRNLLSQEFSDITSVNNVIFQIASGENSVNSIAQRVGEKDSNVVYTLNRLIEVGLVEKRLCMTDENNRKKTQYVLKDSMFKFWYEFVPKAISVIELGKGGVYYDKAVKANLHSFMGSVFEDMCRYYTLERGVEGEFGCFISKVGNWWGVEPVKHRKQQSADIDVVAVSEIDKRMVVGECKFRNEKLDKGVYETLLRRASLFKGKYVPSKYLLFSLGGFTDWFTGLNDPDVWLISIDDLYS